MKFFLVFTITLFSILKAYAQEEDEMSEVVQERKFYAGLRRVNFRYDPPPGYKLSYRPHNAMMGRILLTGSRHQLASLKDSVFVYFTETPIDTDRNQIENLKKFGLYRDPNRTYLAYTDTVNHPIKYHSLKFSRKKFGAERSGTYDLPLPRPYPGPYWYCKTLFINKKDRANIILYFFYNPGSANKVDKHIAALSKRLRFTK